MHRLFFLLQIFCFLTINHFSIANDINWELQIKKQRVSKSKDFYKDLYSKQEFISHINPDAFYGTYLIQNVSYEPVLKIKNAIEKIKNIQLISRGEAHITILTPPEFNKIKESYPDFSMEQIESLYKDKIQNMSWKNLGIGVQKGQNHKGEYSEVYYLVVHSKDLRELRYKIQKDFDISNEVFNPELQDFHVTIGFTNSDLHNIDKSAKTLDKDLAMPLVINQF